MCPPETSELWSSPSDSFLPVGEVAVLSYRKIEVLLTACRNVGSVNRNTTHFPVSSVGKESACNTGDPGSIPGSGRSTGERIGYLPQYSLASLVAQLVKNLPTMRETWVQSLGWEDSLEKGKATHSSILAWRIPWTVLSMGLQKVGHD